MTLAATAPADIDRHERLAQWVDRHSGRIMVLPAVLILLAFAIFPLIVSAYLSLSRFALAGGSFKLTFIGFYNYSRLLVGAQQYHLLGTFKEMGAAGWTLLAVVGLAMAAWLARYVGTGFTIAGFAGRLVTSALILALAVVMAGTVLAGGFQGTLSNTLLYVVLGVAVQFALGLGLALLCAQPIRARSLFRVLFFVPLMVTPVGVAYMFRMLADMQKGPFAPISHLLGFGPWSWATDAWSARLMVLVGDTWQWTPFMFIVLLAAIENQPRDQLEAAHLDGASRLQILRDITWPAIAPVAATVVLIRLIEAFKLIDMPNVLTAGGPGLATESLTLHAFIAWRTQDLGGSAAVGYILLFVSTITCVSFFNFVVRPARRYQ
ncbi:carbohydrate ABC transporter permease [Labrys wisconsinensis]|jgi:multiple sugar transport system permease protein|uniref:Multiple sugar transport system permease protein n=1 Tax=Labrys wisconsinensis TaxID=425677 RepID=A0ABU0JKB5_9HYPH|nr:sugar ABC transporter permease [Labrys wisconsinensis]MDQ0474729.1 multiple sugar transport system permease protein [Labrys wisconsinensis]